jgi:hypothetical protein
MTRSALSLATLAVCAVLPFTQPATNKTGEQLAALYDQHKGDFDYLLGDWEFSATHKEFGPAKGVWSAARLAEGHILDEYRILDDQGETAYVTTTLRAYNAMKDQWELVGLDQGSGLQNVGTGHRQGAEVRIEQKFGVGTAHPTTLRIRYFDIEPDRFSWVADQSSDGGKTWTKDFIRIEAKRVGPARMLPELRPTR